MLYLFTVTGRHIVASVFHCRSFDIRPLHTTRRNCGCSGERGSSPRRADCLCLDTGQHSRCRIL